MNTSKQEYYAIDRGNFIRYRGNGQLQNLNDYEGKYCIEVWKYSPFALTKGVTKQNNVIHYRYTLVYEKIKTSALKWLWRKLLKTIYGNMNRQIQGVFQGLSR